MCLSIITQISTWFDDLRLPIDFFQIVITQLPIIRDYEQTKLKRRFDENPNCTLGINYQPSFFCVIIK